MQIIYLNCHGSLIENDSLQFARSTSQADTFYPEVGDKKAQMTLACVNKNHSDPRVSVCSLQEVHGAVDRLVFWDGDHVGSSLEVRRELVPPDRDEDNCVTSLDRMSLVTRSNRQLEKIQRRNEMHFIYIYIYIYIYIN